MHNLAPLARSERLDALLDALLSAETRDTFVFGVAGIDDADVELSLLPTRDPVATLLGFDAPSEWQAAGVIASSCTTVGTSAPPSEVTIGFLVDRDGSQCSEIRGLGVTKTATDPEGRIVDVCRRVLGLRTAAPRRDTIDLWNAIWLDRTLGAVLDTDLGARRPSWPFIANLHPAADAHAGRPLELAYSARRRAASLPWPVVRRRCAEGTLLLAEIDPAHAAWMDDGMFSRFALDSYASAAEIFDDLCDLLPTTTVSHIARTLAHSGER